MAKKRKTGKIGTNIVVKSNELTHLSQLAMTLSEMRAFSFVASLLDYNADYPENQNVQVQFRKAEFCRAVGIAAGSGKNNKDLIETLNKLHNTTVTIVSKDGKIRDTYSVLGKTRLDETDATRETITVNINRDILPLLTNLKKNFTEYRLENVLGLKSKHAFRLYEFLKSFHSGLHTASIERLKKICPGEYPTVSDYLRKTIAPAIKEINEKTDLFVEWEKKKNGRYVVAIVFNVVEKQEVDEDGDVIGDEEPWTQLTFDDVAATEIEPSDDSSAE